MLSRGPREPIPFGVLLDGDPPGPSHGVDVDEDGSGVLGDGRMYQLVRDHAINQLRISGGVPKPEGMDEFGRLEATFEPARPEVARDTTRPRRIECLATMRRLAARRWRHVQRYADAPSEGSRLSQMR